MKIIIPMAGLGQRFLNEGYKDPKPLIPLLSDNRRIIEHVLDMFKEPDNEFVFICNDIHISTTNMTDIIKELKPNSTILSMPQHKKGPVFTVTPAYDFIKDNEEVIISYCDGTLKFDRTDFLNHVSKNNLDGCIFTHTGFHPHTLSNTKMAFLKEQNGKVLEVKEKAHYTDNPMNEHASSGVYYFKKGSYIKKYFNETMDKNINYNGEYYITLTYNLMIKDNLNIGYYDTDLVAILGTPEEVRNFESWAKIVKCEQIKTEEDLLNCYKYWKNYHK